MKKYFGHYPPPEKVEPPSTLPTTPPPPPPPGPPANNDLLSCENERLKSVALQDAIREIEKLHITLGELAEAESHYRHEHDVRGDGSLQAGRAWDHMRKCGNRARAILGQP